VTAPSSSQPPPRLRQLHRLRPRHYVLDACNLLDYGHDNAHSVLRARCVPYGPYGLQKTGNPARSAGDSVQKGVFVSVTIPVFLARLCCVYPPSQRCFL
jgi:hypothetical protein